jgi:hypothetical protein
MSPNSSSTPALLSKYSSFCSESNAEDFFLLFNVSTPLPRPFFGILFLSLLTPVEQEIGGDQPIMHHKQLQHATSTTCKHLKNYVPGITEICAGCGGGIVHD